MKNVLLLLHDDDGQEARLQAALDLTRALSGHLTCLDVAQPPLFVTDYFTGAGGAIVMDYLEAREAGNRSAIEARLHREDVTWTMLEANGTPADELRQISDLADVIVISGGSDASPEARHLAGQVSVKSGRPVLVVPPSCKGLAVSGPALVAWNGSQEACDALRAAIPLLQQAQRVTVMAVDDPGGESAEDAAAYLARHGIETRIVAEETSDEPVSDIILARAHASGAAYIVLGAFGLPRIVEGLFGGVTEGLLRKSDVPLLLAH